MTAIPDPPRPPGRKSPQPPGRFGMLTLAGICFYLVTCVAVGAATRTSAGAEPAVPATSFAP